MNQYLVDSPYTPFTIKNQFKAISNGKVYIGEVDKDPLNPSQQIQVYVVNESGTNVPVSQPIALNAGGYLVYNGQVSKFVTLEPYSMVVLNSVDAEMWRVDDISKVDPDNITASNVRDTTNSGSVQDFIDKNPDFESIADAISYTKHKIGNNYIVSDYYGGSSPSGSGILFFKVVAAGTGVDDGGKYIDIDINFQLEQNLKKDYSVKYWGAKGNNVDIDSTPVKAAIAYVSSIGGGNVTFPSGTYLADSIDPPNNITFVGFGETVSVIKGVTAGDDTYVLKLSNSDIGEYPYGGDKVAVKSIKIQGLGIDANGLDFGLYAAYCLFPAFENIAIRNAKVRNLFMAAVFTYSMDTVELATCQSVGGSIGENIFSWTGGNEGIICNAGNSRRLFCFGNGALAVYNKVTSPEAGAGLIVRGGSGNTFTSFQGEGNKGVGLYVKPSTQATFYGIYLEANANDGTTEFRQVVNESSAAIFYDVEPRFNSTDTFYASSDTTIFNFLGARITGQGNVSLYGKFSNVTVENPLVHTIKLSEASNVDSAGASTRHTILKPSRYATINSYKTNIWQMGVFIAFRSAQTVAPGKSILIRTIGLTTLATLSLPAGTYADGDVVYLPLLIESTQLEALSVVNLAYGAGWVGIGQIDIGMYIKLMV